MYLRDTRWKQYNTNRKKQLLSIIIKPVWIFINYLYISRPCFRGRLVEIVYFNFKSLSIEISWLAKKIINNKLVTSEKRKTLELKELLIAIQQVGMVSPFNFLSQVCFWRVVLFCLSSFPDFKSLFFTLLWLANKLSWSLASRMANRICGVQSRSLSQATWLNGKEKVEIGWEFSTVCF